MYNLKPLSRTSMFFDTFDNAPFLKWLLLVSENSYFITTDRSLSIKTSIKITTELLVSAAPSSETPSMSDSETLFFLLHFKNSLYLWARDLHKMQIKIVRFLITWWLSFLHYFEYILGLEPILTFSKKLFKLDFIYTLFWGKYLPHEKGLVLFEI